MALEGGEGSASRPGHSLPPGKTQYPLYRKLGGPQGQVWKISPPTGIRSPDNPAHSQLLYRLSYPAHIVLIVVYKFIITSTTDYSLLESNCVTLHFFPSWTNSVMLIRIAVFKLWNILWLNKMLHIILFLGGGLSCFQVIYPDVIEATNRPAWAVDQQWTEWTLVKNHSYELLWFSSLQNFISPYS